MSTLTDNLIAIETVEVRSNYRKDIESSRLAELAENIKKVGVLEPILVRREGESIILIAGARRLAAAKKAGLKEIPARTLDVDAKQAAEIQALENLHRENLGPIEEARAFKSLLEVGSHTLESLAERVDKSAAYVTRSVRLLELPAKMIQALEEGTLTPAHGHQILRAGPKHVEALVKFATTPHPWYKRYVTVDELRQEIERRVEKDLARAVFPKGCAYAGEIACTGCPFNTGNQNALFDGASKGKCTNAQCYSRKTAAFYKEMQAEGTKKFPGLKFLGAAVPNGYGGHPQIKGAWIVQKVDGRIEKAMAAKPDLFGFGILKASTYGGEKPRLVLLCKDAKLAGCEERQEGGYRPPTPEERAKAEFIQRHVFGVVQSTAMGQLKIDKDDFVSIGEMLWDAEGGFFVEGLRELGILKEDNEAAKFPRKAVQALSEARLRQLVVLGLMERAGLEIHELLEAHKVDVKGLWAKAQREAEKLWRDQASAKMEGPVDDSAEGGKEVAKAAAGR